MSLSSDLINDLATLFNTAEFAKSATYTPTAGSPVTIKVLFDSPYAKTETVGISASNSDLAVLCIATDVANARRGETVVINSITYYVISVEPDGIGTAVLRLSRDQ